MPSGSEGERLKLLKKQFSFSNFQFLFSWFRRSMHHAIIQYMQFKAYPFAAGERGEVTERKDVEESGSDEDMAIADKSKSPSP